jgi:hypothetical protein
MRRVKKMSTATNIWPDAQRREAWAREQLEVSSEASAHEARAALLTQIGRDAFVPDDFLLPAYRSLTAPPREDAAEAAFLAGEEQRVCEEVEEFARGMFDLSPDERRQCWQKLADTHSGSTKASARLYAISAGLTVDFDALDRASSQIQQLARWCGELLVLPPPQRSARRRAILTKMTGQRAQWRSIARQLSKRHAAFAALSLPFVRSVADWGHKKKTSAVRTNVQEKWRSAVQGEKTNWGYVLGVLVIGAVFVARVATRFDYSDDRSQQPSYNIPADEWRSLLEPKRDEAVSSRPLFERFKSALRKDEDKLTREERALCKLFDAPVGSERWKRLRAQERQSGRERDEPVVDPVVDPNLPWRDDFDPSGDFGDDRDELPSIERPDLPKSLDDIFTPSDKP